MKVIVIALIAFFVLGACSNDHRFTVSTTTLGVKADGVRVSSCAANADQHLEVKGTAVNSRSKVATYSIQISIADTSGKPLYATAAAVASLQPGATGDWAATTSAPYEDGMTCTVKSVQVTER